MGVVLQQLHVVGVLAVEVSANRRSNRLATLDRVARPTPFSRAPAVGVECLWSPDKAATRRQTIESRIKTALQLVNAAVHRGRICTRSLTPLYLVLVRIIGILLVEAVVLPWLGVAMLVVLRVLLLAVVAEFVHVVGIAGGCTHSSASGGTSILLTGSVYLVTASALQAVLLAHEAYNVRNWALTAGDA